MAKQVVKSKAKSIRQVLEAAEGILNHSKAYRLQPGTGWLVPPCILHAPGSLVTYEPQWGSDVFGMYQSMVEGRYVPWDLLVKDVPRDKAHDLDYLTNFERKFRKQGKAVHRLAYGRPEGAPGEGELP